MRTGFSTIHDYEERVFAVEGFRIFLRPYHPMGDRTLVPAIRDYEWTYAARGDWTIREFVEARLTHDGKRFRWEVKVVAGDGSLPRWNMKLLKLRSTYKR
jgi:hypothetical protein